MDLKEKYSHIPKQDFKFLSAFIYSHGCSIFYIHEGELEKFKEYSRKGHDWEKFVRLLQKNFKTEKEAFLFWYNLTQIFIENRTKYNKMPTFPRKDNKDYINYGSGSSGSSSIIRYPKKNRKTAWKRFYKLFPHLDPNNKEKKIYLTEEQKKLLS